MKVPKLNLTKIRRKTYMLVKRKDIEDIGDFNGRCVACGCDTLWGSEKKHKEGCPVASDSEYLIIKSETSFYKKISSMFTGLLLAGSLSEEEFDRYTLSAGARIL